MEEKCDKGIWGDQFDGNNDSAEATLRLHLAIISIELLTPSAIIPSLEQQRNSTCCVSLILSDIKTILPVYTFFITANVSILTKAAYNDINKHHINIKNVKKETTKPFSLKKIYH